MVLDNIRCSLQDKCGMNKTQINLTLLGLLTILIQGIAFYFIEKDKMNVKLFMFLIISGFFYNIIYFKTYAS
jgi:hypothetical protein